MKIKNKPKTWDKEIEHLAASGPSRFSLLRLFDFHLCCFLQPPHLPHLFFPKVLNWSQLELRIELIQYITNYVKLLESVVIIDYQKDISKNAKQIQDNLEYISTHHEFMDKKEIAVLSSFSTGPTNQLRG